MNELRVPSTKHSIAIFITLCLVACGGGGGGSSPSASSALTGKVIDGYISGATVCLDLNSNGACDTGEPNTTTGSGGSYTLNYPSGTSLANLNVIVNVPVGATDSDAPGSHVTTAYQLTAPASLSQPLYITSLTMLVSQYAAAYSKSIQIAEIAVANALGLPSNTNLFQDYGSNASLHNVAKLVNVVIQNSNLGTSPNSTTLGAAIGVAASFESSAASASSSTLGSILSEAAASAVSHSGTTITMVPTPNYTGDELDVYIQLNAIRQHAGAGLLVQNPYLDSAAMNHASYLVTNDKVSDLTYLESSNVVPGSTIPISAGSVTLPSETLMGAHYEGTITNTGYTGASPLARAYAAGFSSGSTTLSQVSELISFGATSGSVCSASIEDSVYHLVALLSPFINVGLSFSAGNGSGSVCNMELGLEGGENGQLPASGDFVSYPGDGQTGVPPQYYYQSESPSVPGLTSNGGHPVVVSLYNQTNTSISSVTVNSFALTPHGASSPVAVEVLVYPTGVTSAPGPSLTTDSSIPAAGIIVLVPTSPLLANTTYDVSFSATADATPLTKSWSFTTGAMN